MVRFVQNWFQDLAKYKYKRRFFRRSLVLILLIASIPGMIIGTSIYVVTGSKLEGELQRLHRNQIEERAASIDSQLAYLELTFSHWEFEPTFDENLRHLNISLQFERVQELYRMLLIMESSHPLLSRVELYLDKPKPVVFDKSEYRYLSAPDEITAYESLMDESQRAVFWTSNAPWGGGEEAGLSLVNKLPGGSLQPFGVLVATIDSAKLMEMFATLNPYNEGDTIVAAEDGSWAMSGSGGGRTGALSPLDQALRREVGERQDAAGSFLFAYDGTTYSVSYGELSRLGKKWSYISAVPLTAITAPILKMSKSIIEISLAGLALALVLSWLVSKRIYVPIERLVRNLTGNKGDAQQDEFGLLEQQLAELSRERESMRSKLDEQLPQLREGFFLQLVQGHFVSHQESGLREKLKMYGWDADERQFLAIRFQLNGFSSLQGRFSAGDEDLVTFAAANIVEELAREQYEQVGVINFHNFSVGLLLSFPADHPAGWLAEDLDAFCRNVIHTLKRLLRMQVTASVSRPTEFVQQIPRIFEETQQALQFRDLSDDMQILRAGEPSGASSMADNYPFSLEKEIIHAIRNGMEPEAVELIGRFLEELSRGGATELAVQQGMLQLLAGIRYTALQSGLNPVQLFGGVNLFDQLAQIKEPEQMLRWFEHKVVAVIVQELISRQDLHMRQMIEQVVAYLRSHYMEALSLDSCAELFGTSPYTLSRAFKQVTGINFIDYLTQIRIDQAKSLLRESELKINDIADRVGYRHTYFNRIFKKYEGITPSHYRELNRV